jgi:glucoamylase
MFRLEWRAFLTLFISASALADPLGGPPGWPGISHHWPPALKQAIGTSYETSANSPVWFTVSESAISEVYYPHVDQVQVSNLEFIVTDGRGFFSEQKSDTHSQVSYLNDGMTVHISGSDRLGLYTYEQEIVTDTACPALRTHIDFKWQLPGMRVFISLKPTVNNTATQNLGFANNDGLYATHLGGSPHYVALLGSAPWVASSAGYVGISDGWQDLFRNFHLSSHPWYEAGPGNIALTGEVETGDSGIFSLDLALGFGTSQIEARTYASTSLSIPFKKTRANYEAGWQSYLQDLQNKADQNNIRSLSESSFFRQSVEIIKMHEDKLRRGAIVAALSNPSLPGREMSDLGGYHMIWPGDLYHAAMGLMAAGDTKTPMSVLQYFAATQKADGAWPTRFWVDGSTSLAEQSVPIQLDNVAYPILLAGQLQARGLYSLSSENLEMVRKATHYLMTHGPATAQDRWEEMSGSVPSTLAVVIAALKVAATLTHDPAPEETANQWQAAIETLTLSTSGLFKNKYYLSRGESKTLGTEAMDGGFLQLVRFGIRAPDDPRILSTLADYDNPQYGMTILDGANPERRLYRRYYRNSYGSTTADDFWPALSGERGHFSVAAKNYEEASNALSALEESATLIGFLPEHLSAPFRVKLGVACPLVWAHAEDLLLHRSIEEGIVFDAPGNK